MNAHHRNRAVKIIERIVDLANKEKPVKFMRDFGGPGLTVIVGSSHFHTHDSVQSIEDLIDYLYQNLGMDSGSSSGNEISSDDE